MDEARIDAVSLPEKKGRPDHPRARPYVDEIGRSAYEVVFLGLSEVEDVTDADLDARYDCVLRLEFRPRSGCGGGGRRAEGGA
jgi:hypothetical protein